MPHLVPLITNCSLQECYEHILTAHRYLAAQGSEALRRAALVSPDGSWGTTVKRIQVEIRQSDDSQAADSQLMSHNMIEIVNQCATMERLLDTLAWLQREESGLNLYRVAICHPTTTSVRAGNGKPTSDNDLVLIGPNGATAHFEVSDVVGSRDSNRKEAKDLKSLSIIPANTLDNWPSGRRFLVVSKELACTLRKRTRPTHAYREVKTGSLTYILEILPPQLRQ